MIPFLFPGGLSRLRLFSPSRLALSGYLAILFPASMTFVRTPATPRKPFGSALSSLGPPFPPFGLPANQGSFHFYLGSSTFWDPAQQGASGDIAEDVKATPLRIWDGSVADVGITSLVVIGVARIAAECTGRSRRIFRTSGGPICQARYSPVYAFWRSQSRKASR